MTQVTDATVRARALALSDKILSHTIERGGLSRSDLINALVVVLAHERKVGFAKGLEAMTQVTDAMVEKALDAWTRNFLPNWRDDDIQGNFRRDMRAALEAALAAEAEENPTVSAWPIGCHDPTSCGERHRQCMYLKCRHEGRDITSEIDAAIRALSDRS